MSIPAVEPARVEPSYPETQPGGRLTSALDVVMQIVGGRACAVAWLDAWSSVRSSGIGAAAEMEAVLRSRLIGDDEPEVEAELAWTTTLEDREGETVGLLAVDIEPAAAVLPQLAAAARHVGFLLDTSRFEAGRTTAYEALVDVSSRIQVEELKTDEILALITQQARKLMEVDVTWLALLDEERDRVVVKVASGARTDTFVRMWVSVGVGVGGRAIRDRRPVVIRDHRTSDHPTTDLVRTTIDAEGIVSMICVPMVFDGRVVGALYGGSREATDFTDLAVSVFAALAGQAAAAIVHSRLYRNLAEKNDTLEQALTMHQALSQAALEGGGIDGIAEELARVLEREVRVDREGGAARAVSYPPGGGRAAAEPEAADLAADDERIAPIAAGSDRLGTVAALGSEAMSDLGKMALRQAATVMALEILRERAAHEAEWRLRGDLLEEIIQADGDWSEGLQVRAGQLGIDLDQPRALAVLEPIGSYEPHDLELLLQVVLHRDLDNQAAIVTIRGERVLIAFAFDQERASAVVGTLLEKAGAAGMPAVAGLSNPRANLSIALKEATAALRLARAAGPGSHVAHDGGPLRFLLDAPDTDQMTAMVRDLLGPIARRDSERGTGEILGTLQAYLELGDRPSTAERCHVHVSTVKYRMQRAAELLDRSLADPQTRFELQLAFRVRETLMTLGVDPLAGLTAADGPGLPPAAGGGRPS